MTQASAGRQGAGADEAAALSHALETLADLGVVELGTEENAGGLTVVLSPLGVWGVHRRLLAQGWHVPVLGAADRDGAVGLLMTLASCDAEDGESKINEWLVGRPEEQAAAELIAAAAHGTPGLRGAAFAVLDRIGKAATEEVRAALDEPLLRAHAAVWLHEHGEDAELGPADRTWLLVDLGAGLLEEADPRDVVAELLPEVAPEAQAEIVAGLWQVRHPGVIDLLTTLSEHHPDPGVARAARKAAFKARSPGAGGARRLRRLDHSCAAPTGGQLTLRHAWRNVVSIRPIRLFGDPVLRTAADPVTTLRRRAAQAGQGPHRHHDGRAGRRPGRPADRRRPPGVHLLRR